MEKSEMEIRRKIVANWAMAPDGTMIPSMHRHDYRTHETIDTYKKRSLKMDDHQMVPDKTRHTMVDGGDSYLRRGGKFTEMSVYSDDPYEVIRRFVCRGGRGIEGKDFLTYVPLMSINDSWLQAIIDYEEESRPDNPNIPYYIKEQQYRKEHNITIKEHNDE